MFVFFMYFFYNMFSCLRFIWNFDFSLLTAYTRCRVWTPSLFFNEFQQTSWIKRSSAELFSLVCRGLEPPQIWLCHIITANIFAYSRRFLHSLVCGVFTIIFCWSFYFSLNITARNLSRYFNILWWLIKVRLFYFTTSL